MNKPKEIQIIEIGAGTAIFKANICTRLKNQNNELYDGDNAYTVKTLKKLQIK